MTEPRKYRRDEFQDKKEEISDYLKYRAPVNAVKWELKKGDIVETAVGKCIPLPEQEAWAKQIVRFTNMELDYRGGTWRVVAMNPQADYFDDVTFLIIPHTPRTMQVQYLDKDGDVQFVITYTEKPTKLFKRSFTDVVEQCRKAYEAWLEFLLTVDASPEEQYSPARGERSKNSNVPVSPMMWGNSGCLLH